MDWGTHVCSFEGSEYGSFAFRKKRTTMAYKFTEDPMPFTKALKVTKRVITRAAQFLFPNIVLL